MRTSSANATSLSRLRETVSDAFLRHCGKDAGREAMESLDGFFGNPEWFLDLKATSLRKSLRSVVERRPGLDSDAAWQEVEKALDVFLDGTKKRLTGFAVKAFGYARRKMPC